MLRARGYPDELVADHRVPEPMTAAAKVVPAANGNTLGLPIGVTSPDEVVAGNGHAGTMEPVTGPTSEGGHALAEIRNAPSANGQRVCALDGCSTVVVGGRGAQYCSDTHRRRASHQRAAERERSNGSREVCASQTSIEVPAARVVNGSGPWEVLAGVAALLPEGWRLEASSSGVTVSWHQ